MTIHSKTQRAKAFLVVSSVPLLCAVACANSGQAPGNFQAGAGGAVEGGTAGTSIGGQFGSSGANDEAGQSGAGDSASGGDSGAAGTAGFSQGTAGSHAGYGDGGNAGVGGEGAGQATGGTTDVVAVPSRICQARGSTCLNSYDCLQSQYCAAYQCRPAPSAGNACADERCAAGARCVNEQCQVADILEAEANCDCPACKCDVGLSCAWDFEFTEDRCTGTVTAIAGASCASVLCGEGLYCNAVAGVSPPVCRALESMGMGCGHTLSVTPANTCQHGLYCDGLCQPVVEQGKLCSSTDWCKDGLYCDGGHCQPASLGTACGNGNSCQDNSQCFMGTCQVAAGPGEVCVTEPCAPGTHCNDPVTCGYLHTCHLPIYTCVAEALPGESCDDSACATGNICMPTDPAASAAVSLPGSGEVAHAVKVVAGDGFACALLKSSRVRCWGVNTNQQTGVAFSGAEFVPVSPLNFEDTAVVDLSAAGDSACALLASGAVKCWGRNDYGQVGIGAFANYLPPTLAVSLGAPSIAVSAGSGHTCALLDTAQVKCWGDARGFQLGISASQSLQQPGAAMALPGVPKAVASGGSHTCILLIDGRVVCTGSNYFGQLGLGAQAPSGLPGAAVALNAPAIAIATGLFATYAVLENGDLMAWGLNDYGALGVGDVNTRYTPVGPLALGEPAVSVSASSTHACALLKSGQIKCWGDNSVGELGIGNLNIQFLPSAVDQGEPATAIAVGEDLTCALFSEGTIKCWGSSRYGGLGLEDTLDRGGTSDTVPRLNLPIRL